MMNRELKQESVNSFENLTQISSALEMLNSTEIGQDFLTSFEFFKLSKTAIYWILFVLQILATILLLLLILGIRRCRHHASFYTTSGTSSPLTSCPSIKKNHLDSPLGHSNAEFHQSIIPLTSSELVDQV